MTKVYFNYDNKNIINNIKEVEMLFNRLNFNIDVPYDFKYKNKLVKNINLLERFKLEVSEIDANISNSIRDYLYVMDEFKNDLNGVQKNNLVKKSSKVK